MEIFTKHPQWNDVKKICTKIREQGFTAWLAGGCVRDGLMGIVPHDFDIATNARPKKIESFFNRTVDVGKAFGVIRVIVPSGDIEVATFRKDGAYSDGRHPISVELSTPEEDAKRRDFTINALFYDPFEGEIYDYVDGTKDINAKIIRTVGVPADRFMEDRLRILRAVRFVSQLDFNMDDSTWAAVCQFASTVGELKYERIQDEMNKLFKGLRPDRGVKLLVDSSLMVAILPEVSLLQDESEFFFDNLRNEKDYRDLGWVYLLSYAKSEENQDKIFDRFKFSNEKRSKIQNILELVTSLRIFDGLSLSDKKRIAADSDVNAALKFLQLQKSTQIDQAIPEIDLDKIAVFLNKHGNLPARFIEAQDLISLGVKPGKPLGQLLEKCYDAQLEDQILSKSEAVEWVKQQIKVSNQQS